MTHDPNARTPARKTGALAGIAWLGGGQVVGQVITLASRLVLARLLAPEAFGLVAMATVVIAFQDLVTGLGIPAALVQAKELDDQTKSSAFWATSFQGVLVAGVAIAAAPLVAETFDEPELTTIVRVLVAGGALLAPMRLLESLFMRDLRFRAVAVRRAAGKLAGGAVAVGMALGGYGVWSLVCGRLVTTAASLGLVLTAARWWPTLTMDITSLRRLTRFGAGVTFAGVVHAVNKQLPAVVIGRWLGSEALGYFSLAQQVLLLPLTYIARPVANVLFSVFARMQDRPKELAAAFERWQLAVVAGAGLLPGLAAGLAPDAIPLLVGERWAPSIRVFQVLAVPATAQLAVAIVGATLRALGRVADLGMWTLFAFATQAAGILAGLPWQLEGATVGWSLGNVATLLFGVWLAGRALRLAVRRLLRPLALIAPSVAAVVLASRAVSWACLRWNAPTALGLFVAVPLSVAAYGLLLRLTAPGEWAWLRGQVASLLRKRRMG